MNQELSEFAKRFHKLVSSSAAKDPLWKKFGITVQKRPDSGPDRNGVVVEAIVGPAHVIAVKDEDGESATIAGIFVEIADRGNVDITDEAWMWEKVISHIRDVTLLIEEARRAAAINALIVVDKAIKRAGKPMVTEESEAHQ